MKIPPFNRVIAFVFLSTVSIMSAATWSGGDGDWVSDNWGLAGGSPGDATYPDADATLTTAGTVLIKNGDSINMSGNTTITVPVLKQIGGSFYTSGAFTNKGEFTVSGGSFEAPGAITMQSGGVCSIQGGAFIAGPINYTSGTAALNISGGDVKIKQIRMDKNASAASFTVFGSNISSLESQGMSLFSTSGTNSSSASFTFDAAGIKAWTVTGGSTVKLGTGTSAANLNVNVSSLHSNGQTGVILIDYAASSSVEGAFHSISITDTTYGTLSPGTMGALNPGEYYLDYGSSGASTSAITLYYNTTPRPATQP